MTDRPATSVSRRLVLLAPLSVAAAAGARRAQAADPAPSDASQAAARAIAADPRLLAMWRCGASECPGYTYDPLFGEPLHDVAPFTAFEDLTNDFYCPLCGAGILEFVRLVPRALDQAVADAIAGPPQW